MRLINKYAINWFAPIGAWRWERRLPLLPSRRGRSRSGPADRRISPLPKPTPPHPGRSIARAVGPPGRQRGGIHRIAGGRSSRTHWPPPVVPPDSWDRSPAGYPAYRPPRIFPPANGRRSRHIGLVGHFLLAFWTDLHKACSFCNYHIDRPAYRADRIVANITHL